MEKITIYLWNWIPSPTVNCVPCLFLSVCVFVKLQCDRQHSVEFFVLNLHLISFIKELSGKVTLSGARGDGAFPGQTRTLSREIMPGRRETGS